MKVFLVNLFLFSSVAFGLSKEAIDKNFVYLHDVDSTILTSLRYKTPENLIGEVVDGYRNNVVIMTKQCAEALKKVQAAVKKDGYSLVVYDAYRPQRAVNNFIRWSKNNSQVKKTYYYPRVDKTKVFDLGYVAKRSGHSRGSTVDLTLIKIDDKLYEVQPIKRTLLDGFEILFLADGTVDMGSHFDFLDVVSHDDTKLVEKKYKRMRIYLKNIMAQHGFKVSPREWWHFTLAGEPYSATNDSSYFNFPVA